MILEVLAVLAALFLLLSQYERKHPVVTEYRLSFRDLPESFDGYRILYFSDLHGSRFGAQDESFRQTAAALPADLYLFGGDMVTVKKNARDFTAFRDLLAALPSETPKYFGRGNHEVRMETEEAKYPGWETEFSALLKEYGVLLLRNERVTLSKGKDEITLSALEIPTECYGAGPKKGLTENYIGEKLGKPGNFELLMLHSPLYRKEIADYGAKVSFSGHFHGGTIYLGPLGGLMTPQYCFFSPDCRGVKEYDGKYGIVGAGLGTHSIHIRIFDRPEIVSVTLVKE